MNFQDVVRTYEDSQVTISQFAIYMTNALNFFIFAIKISTIQFFSLWVLTGTLTLGIYVTTGIPFLFFVLFHGHTFACFPRVVRAYFVARALEPQVEEARAFIAEAQELAFEAQLLVTLLHTKHQRAINQRAMSAHWSKPQKSD